MNPTSAMAAPEFCRRREQSIAKIDNACVCTSEAARHAVDAGRSGVVANRQSNDRAGGFIEKTQSDPKGGVMYRILVITGLCALAMIVTVGQLGSYLHDYKAADGQHQGTQYAQKQARQDFPTAERQQPRHCYRCALSTADLSLSDATFDGVTITNHSKNAVQEITLEVTIKDCPPGHNPATANSADQCVIVSKENKGVDVFIPPGQARGFHSYMNFRGGPLPPQSRRFFLWRIVSAKGMDAP